jgi:hypothetical protein
MRPICSSSRVAHAGKTLLRRSVGCANAWGPQPHAISLACATFFVIGTACSTRAAPQTGHIEVVTSRIIRVKSCDHERPLHRRACVIERCLKCDHLLRTIRLKSYFELPHELLRLKSPDTDAPESTSGPQRPVRFSRLWSKTADEVDPPDGATGPTRLVECSIDLPVAGYVSGCNRLRENRQQAKGEWRARL